MNRLLSLGIFSACLLVRFSVVGLADDAFIAFQATEDAVFGHKDGMALTLDVIELRPTEMVSA